MGSDSSSSSSSIDSTSCYPYVSSSSSNRDFMNTDLSLGLSISSSSSSPHHNSRGSVWPPIKPLMRNTFTNKRNNKRNENPPTLFVKVYMRGFPIGRKLDLFTIHSYDDLIQTLSHMFKTTLLYPDADNQVEYDNVLTYEDKEGDWMMVGDVPWNLFLASVKRLKITSSHLC